jgi:hypothetical protein
VFVVGDWVKATKDLDYKESGIVQKGTFGMVISPNDPKLSLLVNWTKGGAPATLSNCAIDRKYMGIVQKADASEIVKTGDIVSAAYDLNYGKDHGMVVAGCLGTITDIAVVPSESTASWNVTWHRTNIKGSLAAKAQRNQFQKCKPTEFFSEGDILKPSRDLKIALKAAVTISSMSLPGAPTGTITITKDTLGILEKLDVFDSDD